jgi:hypothetical protein
MVRHCVASMTDVVMLRWLMWWRDNWGDEEITDEQLATALKHFHERVHPWESAAGVGEGREPDRSAHDWFETVGKEPT